MADAPNNAVYANPKRPSGWNIAFGIWLLIAPFVLGYSASAQAFQNDLYIGMIVLILAIVGVYSAEIRWSRTVNLLAGIWLIIAPFVLGYASVMAAVWNDVIAGALVFIFSSWSLSAANQLHHQFAREGR